MALSFSAGCSAWAEKGDVFLGGLADGGVIDEIEPEGAGQVLGEPGVGRVGLDQFEGDGLADRLGAACGLLGGRRGGLAGGHDLDLSRCRGVRRPDAGVLPLGCGLLRPGKAGGEKGAQAGPEPRAGPAVLHGRGEHGEDPPFRGDRRPA